MYSLKSDSSLSLSSALPLIEEFVPLGSQTWFKTGGRARWLSRPATCEAFQALLLWACERGIAIDVIGEGANMLVSDAGCPHLVIRPVLEHFAVEYINDHAYVTAGGGMAFPHLIVACLEQGLIGLEEFSGIPGTVGGSVFINIHYFNYLLSDFLVKATVIEKSTWVISSVDREWFQFGYNTSTLQSQEHFLLDATFRLRRVDPVEAAYARGRSTEIIRHRKQRYPAQRTCGSFFRNFHEHEVTVVSNGKKMIYVAYYLDKLGIKGQLRVGGAQVSYQHANMIVTDATATSSDVVELARTMQRMVYDAFGIIPQPECRFLGFEEYPLIT